MTACPHCTTLNPPGNRYCFGCGQALQHACASCGERMPFDARFCGACGTPAERQRPLGPSSAEAELKHATVLFADIVSSTRLIAAMDAEQSLQFLSPVVASMAQTVVRHGGTIGRTLGDGLMALFGAPQAHEGHAVLACQTAIALHAAGAEFDGIRLRVGIHSGEVAIHTRADGIERDLLLHGKAIHLASRVVSMAEPGTTFLTQESLELAASRYDAALVGARQAQGFDVPVQLHRLLGPRTVEPSDRTPRAMQTALRGRSAELARLRAALAEAEGGASRIVGIVGAPGSGKSRLCAEFAAWCRERQVPVLEARAQLYGHATPLQPVLEFLRSAVLHVGPGDDASAIRRHVAALIETMDGASPQDEALLDEFLGVAEEPAATLGLGAKARRARLLGLVGRMVRHLAKGPLVILIEDLHWMDAASAEFFAALIDAVADTPTLLLVNYRPGCQASWMSSGAFGEIALGELGEDDVVRLVEELIGERSEIHDFAVRIARRSGGNPFFAEEMVRALMADGTLVGRPSQLLLGAKAREAPLPATVQAVIGGRIDQLDDASKSLLQLCSIAGKDFPLGVLQQVMRVAPVELRRRLDALCAAEFLTTPTSLNLDLYAFRHPLIQEVAYQTQLKRKRAPLHAEVAGAMVAFYGSMGDEFAGLIAHHYEAAGKALDAADYLGRAAAWIGAKDSAQALRHWQKVRELLLDQPDEPKINVVRSRASIQIALLGWREGITVEQIKPVLDEALALARRHDPRMVPMLLFLEGRNHIASGGSSDYYVDCLRQALQLLGDDNTGRRAILNTALSQAYGWAGLLHEALAASDAALAEIGGADAGEQFLGYRTENWALNLRGRVLVRLGRFDEARECFQKMLSIPASELDPTVRFIAHMGSLEIALAQADTSRTDEHALQVELIARQQPNSYLRVFALAAQGLFHSVAGEFETALKLYGSSLELLRVSRVAMEYESELLASVAECHLAVGQRKAAALAAQEAVEVSRDRATRLPECRACLVLAAATGDASEAAAWLSRAEDLAARTGALIHLPVLRDLGAHTKCPCS
ncbi:MAG TPA: AAA family ATPase [Variovorax sp.]|nr:AAA family ATPase [Variovorax sp.]